MNFIATAYSLNKEQVLTNWLIQGVVIIFVIKDSVDVQLHVLGAD